MKRFLLFTLALLLATTALVLTEAEAFDYDWKHSTLWGDVEAETYVSTSYDLGTQTASSYHWYYLQNGLPGAVKGYVVSEATFVWKDGFSAVSSGELSFWVDGKSGGSSSYSHSLWMGDKDGSGSVSASSNMRVRNLANGETRYCSGVSCSTSFVIADEL